MAKKEISKAVLKRLPGYLAYLKTIPEDASPYISATALANALGMEAYGVSADLRGYAGQTKRDVREILARIKDRGYSLFKPAPTYLGDPISLDQSGDITNDQ